MDRDDQTQATVQPPPTPSPPKKVKKQYPQKNIDDFWDNFTTKFPGKVHTILPKNVYAQAKAANEPKGTTHGQAAVKSYEQAKVECMAAVDKIARECRRVNMRYRDPHFDIEFDLKWYRNQCLEGLLPGDESFDPRSVKRIPEIFDKPQFYVDDATPSDVRQGNDGDCWFLSALCALGNKPGLINKICVARDEAVGVYGFVFHRDGEWIQTVIDDKLYLTKGDYDEDLWEKSNWNQLSNRQNAEEEYLKANQRGSQALYFAQCSNENETWLPLLEKAYAKAHGDFRSISGGFTGEAIEDLTGGVTTELFTSDILDKEKFWTDEIMQVNKEFLFGCATGVFDNWQGFSTGERKGIYTMHAYSILEAREEKGERLLRVRNPWGKMEWQGPWSDGSEQWTPGWMEILNHRFGNDGMFWISYKDLLRKYQCFDRTRLFGPEWSVTQQWTTLDVPWSADYNDTKFTITLDKKGPIVIVLSQLDDRYYRGMEGQYDFSLHFRLEKDGEHDYIVRSHGNYMMSRSVSTDLELDAGTYSVLMKITATRAPWKPTPEQILRDNCKDKQEKLLQIGLAYDLAHAKGQIHETEQDLEQRKQREERKKTAARQKQREEAKKSKYKNWLVEKKQKERIMRRKQKAEDHRRKKAEASKAVEASHEVSKGEEENVGARTEKPREGTTVPVTEYQATSGVVESKPTEFATKNTEDQTTNGAKEPEPVLPDTGTTPSFNTTQATETNAATETEATAVPESTKEAAQVDSATAPKDTTHSQPVDVDSFTSKSETTQAKIDRFNKELSTIPAVQINGVSATPSEAPSALAPPLSNINAGASDTSSIITFSSSIDSDLDLPPLDSADPNPQSAPQDPQIPDIGGPAIGSDDDDENAEFANDPWNAVCVVGLRVYSKDKGVSVGVMRPKNESEETGEGESKLDLDDASKGASGECEAVKEDGKEAEKDGSKEGKKEVGKGESNAENEEGKKEELKK